MNNVIIDYGSGNLSVIKHKISKIGISSIISSSYEDIKTANSLIICGVGHFSAAMENLNKKKLVEIINEKVLNDKIPILGICLGMQLFAKSSEEGSSNGFGWIDANVKKFKFDDKNYKVPHIGWQKLSLENKSLIFKDVNNELKYYFIHSYQVICKNKSDILATTNYGGGSFVSAVEKENIIGTQFHPEKSHKSGMKVIENFFNYFVYK